MIRNEFFIIEIVGLELIGEKIESSSFLIEKELDIILI